MDLDDVVAAVLPSTIIFLFVIAIIGLTTSGVIVLG